jgi:hypothetical protein
MFGSIEKITIGEEIPAIMARIRQHWIDFVAYWQNSSQFC